MRPWKLRGKSKNLEYLGESKKAWADWPEYHDELEPEKGFAELLFPDSLNKVKGIGMRIARLRYDLARGIKWHINDQYVSTQKSIALI